MQEGRGWSADGLPRYTTDVEDRMARRIGNKRLQWRVWFRVKELARDRDLGHILFQHRRACFWPEFDNGDGLRSVPTAEGHLACGPGLAQPAPLAIGGNEPAIRAFLHQGYWCRVACAGSSASHRQQIRVSRSETHTKEGLHQPIKEAAPAAQAIGR